MRIEKTTKLALFGALLGATALGFSISGNAEGYGTGSSSGAGVSAGSQVGASGGSNGLGDAGDHASAASAPVPGTQTAPSVKANGSTSAGDFDAASTPDSEVLSTSDSSSTDSIPLNNGDANANNPNTVADENMTPTTTTTTTILSWEDNNTLQASQISSIQSSLNSQGFKVGSVDGIWGPRTASALREFQAKNNLTANGQISMDTARALRIDGSSVNGTEADGRLNGNSSTAGTDSGSGTGY